MGTAKRVWTWIREHVEVVAVTIIAALVFLLYRSLRDDESDSLRGALAVAKAERDVAKLTERRDAAVARADAREEDLAVINTEIAETRRTIVEGRIGAANLSDDAILVAYRRLGYIR